MGGTGQADSTSEGTQLPAGKYRRYGFGTQLIVESASSSSAPNGGITIDTAHAPPARPSHRPAMRPHARVAVETADKRIAKVQDAARRDKAAGGVRLRACLISAVREVKSDAAIKTAAAVIKGQRVDEGNIDLAEGIDVKPTVADLAAASRKPLASGGEMSSTETVRHKPYAAKRRPAVPARHVPPVIVSNPFAAVPAQQLADRLMEIAQAHTNAGDDVNMDLGGADALADADGQNEQQDQELLDFLRDVDLEFPDFYFDMAGEDDTGDAGYDELLEALKEFDDGDGDVAPAADFPLAVIPLPFPPLDAGYAPNVNGAARDPDACANGIIAGGSAATEEVPVEDERMEGAAFQVEAVLARLEDRPECAICYEEADELVEAAAEAGKGGVDGELVMYSCGLPNCASVFCIPCMIRNCNIQLDARQPIVCCPTCTRPIDIDRLEVQAKAYDPTIAHPLRRPPPPPPPPHIIFRQWIDRYQMSRIDHALDHYEAADFIVYTMTHACGLGQGAMNHIPTPLGDFHIACCVKVWGERFGLDKRTVLAHVKDACGVALVLPEIEGEGARQGNRQRATVREAFPAAPALPTPAEAHNIPMTPDRAAILDRRIGSLQPAIDALNSIQLVLGINGLNDWAQACADLATHLAVGKDHFIKLFASCESLLLQFILDLLHDPRLVVVRQGISVSPLILLVGRHPSSFPHQRTRDLSKGALVTQIADGLRRNSDATHGMLAARADYSNAASGYYRPLGAPPSEALAQAVKELNRRTAHRNDALARVRAAGGVLVEHQAGGDLVWIAGQDPAGPGPQGGAGRAAGEGQARAVVAGVALPGLPAGVQMPPRFMQIYQAQPPLQQAAMVAMMAQRQPPSPPPPPQASAHQQPHQRQGGGDANRAGALVIVQPPGVQIGHQAQAVHGQHAHQCRHAVPAAAAGQLGRGAQAVPAGQAHHGSGRHTHVRPPVKPQTLAVRKLIAGPPPMNDIDRPPQRPPGAGAGFGAQPTVVDQAPHVARQQALAEAAARANAAARAETAARANAHGHGQAAMRAQAAVRAADDARAQADAHARAAATQAYVIAQQQAQAQMQAAQTAHQRFVAQTQATQAAQAAQQHAQNQAWAIQAATRVAGVALHGHHQPYLPPGPYNDMIGVGLAQVDTTVVVKVKEEREDL